MKRRQAKKTTSPKGLQSDLSNLSNFEEADNLDKIALEMMLPPILVTIFTKLSRLIPTWKIVHTDDVVDLSIKLPEVRKQARKNPFCYKGRLRLRTAVELLRITVELQQRLHEVTLPFIVLHGEADKVTDTSVSKQLYEIASSRDKTLKLWPGMCHALLYGEPPENIEILFSDTIKWLDERCSVPNSKLKEQKTCKL